MSYRVFIGWDEHEVEAFHVLAHSIYRHASAPVAIAPLKLSQLPMTRDRTEYQSTEFSFSRFLVPWLCDYKGKAVFMDADMMVTDDIIKLFQQGNERYAVQCVKHDYTPTTEMKFLGQKQSQYERKNWSAVMLFNNAKCQKLTPEVVNNESGLYLHQFKWLEDSEIGELTPEWNFLVDEYESDGVPANIHWTLGGPYFNEYANVEFADLWREERQSMVRTIQRTR